MSTAFGAVVRQLRAGLGAVTTACSPVETNRVPADWTHVTKVDPELDKKFPLLYPLYLRHTDAVSVGGSSNVSGRNTEDSFELLSIARPPAIHEPSEARHVTDRTREMAAFLAIPEVLNGDANALVGTLGEGIAYLEDELVPELLDEKLPPFVPLRVRDALVTAITSYFLDRSVFEAYIIQNPDSAAARRGGVDSDDLLDPTEARQRALAADRHLESEILYVEYSGTFGGEEASDILAAVEEAVTRARVWYGGGIDSREKARRMLDSGADTVVVGDIFHDVAEEEGQLLDAARETFDEPGDVSMERVREWVAEWIDPEESAAVRYLSTIPDVRGPESTAIDYHARTVRLWLAVGVDEGALDATGRQPLTESDLRTVWDSRAVNDLLGAIPDPDDDRHRSQYLRTLAAALADANADGVGEADANADGAGEAAGAGNVTPDSVVDSELPVRHLGSGR